MRCSYFCLHLLSALSPAISSALVTPYEALDRRTQTASIKADFEDTSLNQGSIIRDLYGLHFDGFASLVEAAVGQLILYKGGKAALPAPSGNEVRTDLSNSKYESIDLESVAVGCFLNKKLGTILGSLPLSSVGLGDLATALKGFSGAASTASTCSIRVRVLAMTDTNKWHQLTQAGHDFVDCQFTPTLNVAGQGVGEVKKCDLSKLGWSGVTRLNFTIQSVGTVSTGPGTAIGNTAPVIDDLIATGHLK